VARAAGVSARRAFGLRAGRSPLRGLLALNVDTPQSASIAGLPSQNRLQAHEADRIDRLSSFHARSVSRMLEGPALPHGRHRLARRRPRAHHAAPIDSRPSRSVDTSRPLSQSCFPGLYERARESAKSECVDPRAVYVLLLPLDSHAQLSFTSVRIADCEEFQIHNDLSAAIDG